MLCGSFTAGLHSIHVTNGERNWVAAGNPRAFSTPCAQAPSWRWAVISDLCRANSKVGQWWWWWWLSEPRRRFCLHLLIFFFFWNLIICKAAFRHHLRKHLMPCLLSRTASHVDVRKPFKWFGYRRLKLLHALAPSDTCSDWLRFIGWQIHHSSFRFAGSVAGMIPY